MIEEIHVEGNTISSDRMVFKNIRTRKGQMLAEHILNEDIKRLYELDRFKKIEIKREVTGQKIVLTIVVEEKPIIRNKIFLGYKNLKPDDFEEDIQSLEGERYDESSVNADKNHITQKYKENGYLFTLVDHRVIPVKGKVDQVDVQFIIDESPQVKIGDITFHGNDHVESKRLLKLMELRIDRFYNKGVYDPDMYLNDLNKIQSYYQSLGYLDAKATYGKSYFSEDKNWLFLNVDVDEGSLYIVDGIHLEGYDVVTPDAILKDAVLKVGMPYSDYVRIEFQDHIEKFYGEIGRIFTRVHIQPIIDEKKFHVQLNVKIIEGEEVYLNEVRIYGNAKTKDVVIRRELEFYPLERINSKLIQESRRNLYNLGFFEKVLIEPIPTDKSNQANIEIRVSEKQTGSVNFALGFSSVEAIFAQVKYMQRNFDWRDTSKGGMGLFNGQGFIGDGQNLQIAVNTGSRSRRFTIDFSEPWVFNRKIRFGFGLFHTESEISDDFDENRDGLYTRIGKEFLKDLEGFLTYGLSNIKISDIDPNVSPAIREQEGTNIVSSLRNDWIYDSRDNRFFPTLGWYIKPSLMVAGGPVGGNQDFYKSEFEIKTYKKLFTFGQNIHHVLSGRIRLGYAKEYGRTDKVPIFERFFAGGLGSVRGFENRSLGPREGVFEIGGNFLTLFNVEYTFPISEQNFRGVFFYDQGNVYENVDTYSYSEMRSAVGFGVRIQIDALGPFPIALDFAKAVKKEIGDETETFSFNFGNFF